MCEEKVSQRCKKVFASCVQYQGTLPEYSELTNCADIQEVSQEQYELITDIKESLDLSELDSECLEAPINPTLKNWLNKLAGEICALKTLTENQAETIAEMQQQIEDLQTNTCP